MAKTVLALTIGVVILAAWVGTGEGNYFQLPKGCPDPAICLSSEYTCDSRATAQCWDGTMSSRGAGQLCCCPVCYRKEGARCNNIYRICRPDLECRQGHCRPKMIVY